MGEIEVATRSATMLLSWHRGRVSTSSTSPTPRPPLRTVGRWRGPRCRRWDVPRRTARCRCAKEVRFRNMCSLGAWKAELDEDDSIVE